MEISFANNKLAKLANDYRKFITNLPATVKVNGHAIWIIHTD